MKAKRPLFHAAYALLIGSAFVAGRFSNEKKPAGEAALIVEHPSLLVPAQKAEAPSGAQSGSEDVAENSQKALSADDFAQQVAEMLKVGNMDYHVFSQVVEAWVDKDPLGAIDFLAGGERRDEMLRWIVSVWGSKHPEDASRWLAGNQEMEGLDHAVEGLAQGIQREDPESALKWAGTIQDPVVKARVLTSSGFQQYRHDHELAETALAESGLPSGAQDAIRESWTKSWKSTAKRNSQNVSSVASAAQAAGVAFDKSSVEAFVEQIRKGVRLDSGPFKGQSFGVPNLTPLEGEAILHHLRLQGEVLAYTPGDD